MSYIKLPENATTDQINIYNKNYELFELAKINMHRYGTRFGLCTELGSQDAVFWNIDRFNNIYPYSNIWYNLAYGKSYNDESNS